MARTPPLENEREVIEAAKRGDGDALGTLLDHYGWAIWKFARSKTSCDEDASDIQQEAFLAAWKSIETFEYRRPGGFLSWMFKIAQNKVYESYREKPTTPLQRDGTPMQGLSPEYGEDGKVKPARLENKASASAAARFDADYEALAAQAGLAAQRKPTMRHLQAQENKQRQEKSSRAAERELYGLNLAAAYRSPYVGQDTISSAAGAQYSAKELSDLLAEIRAELELNEYQWEVLTADDWGSDRKLSDKWGRSSEAIRKERQRLRKRVKERFHVTI